MDRRYRILVIVLLVFVSIGANVQYASTEFRSYPEKADIIATPADEDGKQVFLFARVAAITEQTGEMTVLLEEKKVTDVRFGGTTVVTNQHELTVRSTDPAILQRAEPGTSVQIYGTLRDGSTVLVAENSVIDYQNSGDWNYVFGTSILGAIVAAVYFLWYWRPNWRGLYFETRGDS